ncbi:unnamed protein product, partial [Symbiodinium sp. CCMP2456]
MSEEQREDVRGKAAEILLCAGVHLRAYEEPDPQQMLEDARQVRKLAQDVLRTANDHRQEAEVGPTAASCFEWICLAARMMQKLGAEDFHGQCLHLAGLCLQATRQVEEILVAEGVPTAIVSEAEESGEDYFYIPESGTQAESGAITAPTRTADPSRVDSVTNREPHELVVEEAFVEGPGEGQLVAHRQGLESQLQQMRAEQTGLPLAETLRKLGSALLEEGEPQHARQARDDLHQNLHIQQCCLQAMDYLHQSLQIQRCLQESAAHLSIADTLYDLGRASSILKNQEQALQYFHESLEIRQRVRLAGDGKTVATLYRLSAEYLKKFHYFFDGGIEQARVFVEKALNLADSLWPGYLDLCAVSASCRHAQELIEAGDGWAYNFREVLRGRDLEFCRVLTARDKPLIVLPSADSADLIDAPLPEDFPLQVWLKAPGKEDRRTLTSLLQRAAHLELGDGRPDTAAAEAATSCLQKSLRVVGCLAGDQDNESAAKTLYELGRMRAFAKDFEGAVCYLEEALRMKKKSIYDQDTASVAKTLALLGKPYFLIESIKSGEATRGRVRFFTERVYLAYVLPILSACCGPELALQSGPGVFDAIRLSLCEKPAVKGEDEEGDDEAEDEEDQDGLDMDDWKAGTEAEDLVEEGADADDEEEEDEDGDDEEGADAGAVLREILVNESDEYQPGATQEDVGQCDDDDSPRPLSRETPVVDEDMLLAATAPLLIDGPVKKKRKKKKKKKKRRLSKTVVVVDVPAE